MANNEIQTLVANFAAQVEAIAKRAALEQVLATLGGTVATSAPAKRGPGRPKGSTNAPKATAPAATKTGIKPIRKGTRRSAEDVKAMGEALIAHVKANPGHRGEQIAAALRTDVNTIRLPMQALSAAKKITTRGQRRGMQYFVPGSAPKGVAPKAAKKARKSKKS